MASARRDSARRAASRARLRRGFGNGWLDQGTGAGYEGRGEDRRGVVGGIGGVGFEGVVAEAESGGGFGVEEGGAEGDEAVVGYGDAGMEGLELVFDVGDYGVD